MHQNKPKMNQLLPPQSPSNARRNVSSIASSSGVLSVGLGADPPQEDKSHAASQMDLVIPEQCALQSEHAEPLGVGAVGLGGVGLGGVGVGASLQSELISHANSHFLREKLLSGAQTA